MAGECDKHQECMERIHTDINAIKETNAKSAGVMEGFTKSVNDFLGSIRKDIYSPGGIVERVGNHSFQLVLQWGILGAVIIAGLIEYFKK
jgi:hypothetical protein